MRPWNPSVVVVLSIAMMVGTARAQTGGPADGAAASSAKKFTPEDMDQLLAPIALYPDALIIQIVQCAASPYQVKQVNDWLKKNPDLKGTAVQDAAAEQGFDASFIALVVFPQVVGMMADKADWTKDLGHAFTTDRDSVFASIQRLRAKAKEAGNLSTTEQQKVEVVTADAGQQVIVIQPSNPQVVYVPQYDPKVVYVESTSKSSSDGDVAAAALIGFAAGVIVGALADNDHDHYYYAYGGWGYHHPVCYPGGYNNFYRHRENMANDWYRHRENMAGQRQDNRTDRVDHRTDTRTGRQDNRTDTRTNRQDTRSGSVANRQDTRTDTRATRQDARPAAQATNRQPSRGSFQGRSRPTTQGTSLDSHTPESS